MSEGTGTTRSGRPRDEASFEEFYRRYYRPVREFCRRRVPDHLVDDAVAETFLTAWRRLDAVPCGGDALVWLYGVAYRVVGRQWRSTARRRRLEDRLRAFGRRPVSTDESTVDDFRCQLVLDAAARLGAKDAEVLRLQAWEQLSVSEIAAVIGIAPNAVKQRLHRARQHLAREYRRLELKSTLPPDIAKDGVW